MKDEPSVGSAVKHMKCAFTGHRQIKPSHLKKLQSLLTRAINFAYSEGCRDFLCGGAVGFDTLAAEAVIDFRRSHPDARLSLVLPCKNQSERWSPAQRTALEQTVREADEVVWLHEEYSESCMRERNEVLARECDILIAYLYRRASGAGQTASMATRLGKRVYNLCVELEK